MFSFRVRPKIRCVTPMTKEEIFSRFNQFLKDTDKPIRGRKLSGHIELYVNPDQQHYWSPILTIVFDAVEGGTAVKGRFGPHPKVWTMYMFFYFFALVLTLFSGLVGAVQLQMGKSPWAFWIFWVGVLLLVLIYLAAQVGQRKGQEQTDWLMTFCTEVLKE